MVGDVKRSWEASGTRECRVDGAGCRSGCSRMGNMDSNHSESMRIDTTIL